jgi:hypothetical protein
MEFPVYAPAEHQSKLLQAATPLIRLLALGKF